jgi:hypothetical protein
VPKLKYKRVRGILLDSSAVIISVIALFVLVLLSSVSQVFVTLGQRQDSLSLGDSEETMSNATMIPDNQSDSSTILDLVNSETNRTLLPEDEDIPYLKELEKQNVAPSEYLGNESKQNISNYTVGGQQLSGEEFIEAAVSTDTGHAITDNVELDADNPTIVENNSGPMFADDKTSASPKNQQQVLNESHTLEGNTMRDRISGNQNVSQISLGGHDSDDTDGNSRPSITYIGHTEAHRSSNLRIFKYVGGDRIQTDASTVLEPAVASNGRSILYTGNYFVRSSADAGTSWSSDIDYNQQFYHARAPSGTSNNAGDNDVVYSQRIQKFIWYRQGGDGRFNLAISPDLTPGSWRYINVEANNFRSELSLDTVLRNNGLPAPRGTCTDESTRECNINFWWDFPQLAVTERYLYISTDVMLGCGRDGLTNPMCAPGQNAFYGSLVLRASLDDLNRNIVDQRYFQQSQHHYYDRSYAFQALAQGARETMYWGTIVAPNQLKICSWVENESAFPLCVNRNIPAYNTDGIACPGKNDNRNWCASNRPDTLLAGWAYAGKVGFLWNVAADPVGTATRNYPYPWIKAAVFSTTNDLNYLPDESARYSLASNTEWIQLAFTSVNQRGMGLMAWYGDFASPPGLLLAISDEYSPNGWQTFRWLRPVYDVSIGTSGTPPPSTNIRLGDYLRVRPYAGSSNLWEASGFYVTGDAVNPIVETFYVIFGRAADEPEYRLLSNEAPDCSSASPSQPVLWPPNHRMIDITIQNIIDPDGDPLTIRITSIRQDEPTRGQGMGDQSPDGAGIGTSTAQIRIERAGNEDGRVYHISFTANDGRGGECTGEVVVSVPHDQRGVPARDSGARFDSTQ